MTARITPKRVGQGLKIAAFSALMTLAACGGHEEGGGAAQPGQGQQPRAVAVTAITVQEDSVPSVRELSGRARAYAEAEIRPQVTGLIEKRLFTEGEQVEEGQALYQIEDSEYQAAVDSARADLEGAEANAEAASETAERFKRLAEINAVSRQEYDEAVAAASRAEANIGIARAALRRAQIDLKRTTVRSPISGQIGRSNVTPGALVTANQATTLARVLQLDPIYVDLTASSNELLRWKRQVANGAILTTGDSTSVPVTVKFEDGEVYPYEGSVEFSEVNVDEAAGTVIVRAVVPNPDGLLLPGMFVKAEFSAGSLDSIFLLPQKVVQRNPRGEAFVYVVGEDGTATQRPVTMNGTHNSQWIVTSGLESGDRVISSGLQNLRGGETVNVRSGAEAPSTAQQSAGPNQ